MNEIKRRQTIRHQTGRKKIWVYAVLLIVITAVGITGGYLAANRDYRPPEFDSTAKTGTPAPKDSFRYGGIDTDYDFTFKMAATLYQQEDGMLRVYMTNPGENNVYLMCEIVNASTGKTLYKSGVIRPGDYVEQLKPSGRLPAETAKVDVKIYAFDPEDWRSSGTVIIENTLQTW